MNFKKVCVVGLGYIGLPTAGLIAKNNILVTGVDKKLDVVNSINSGKTHFIEPGLEKIIKSAVEKNKLVAKEKPETADVFIISVPTPLKTSNNKNPKPDLKFVKSACKSISSYLKKNNLIIIESTCPVGTTIKFSRWLEKYRPDLRFPCSDNQEPDVSIAYCPERVLPGNIVRELVDNKRVIGGITKKCTNMAINFYKSFVKGECIGTNSITAEMVKLTENASRDLQIAFANELSIICDKENINVWKLIELANMHPRVNILSPGPGVGGHCIAVDPWFIVDRDPKNSKLITMARMVNLSKTKFVIKKIKEAIRKSKKKNPKIALLGITFKENIDDIRESPALEIAKELSKFVNDLVIIEPNLESLPEVPFFKNAKLRDLDIGIKISDIVVSLVNHKEFHKIENKNLERKVVIDVKNILESKI